MVQIGSWSLYWLFISLFSLKALAAPEVSATVDTNKVAQGEVLQLSITVSSDSQMAIEDLRLPPLDGFDLLNSSQQSRQMWTNGQMQISQGYVFLLQANKVGTLTIPSIEVNVNGQIQKTKPIEIKVAKGDGKPKLRAQAPPDEEEDPFFDEGESLFQQLLKRHGMGRQQGPPPKINPDEAFFVQLEADKNEAYVGEQITATWYLYTRNAIQNIDTLKYPNLRAFFKEDIEVATRLDWQQEVVNGIPYRKALLVSYALFPLKEGAALVDSYKARCAVLMGGGPFGFGQSYTFTKASQELKVKVKPIPVNNRPADFAGGVGQFHMKASVDQSNVAVNQPFALKIRFEGRGNAKSVDLPSMDLPKSLENYSQRNESKFSRDGTSFKEFEILLIPREVGKVVIPKITMSFFDPVRGSFYSESSNPIELNVGAGKGGAVNPSVNPTPTVAQEAVRKTPELITEWDSYKPKNIFSQLFWWFVVFGAAIALGVWRVFVELQIGSKKKSLNLRMQKRLKQAHAQIAKSDWRKTGAELTNTIYMVLGAITGDEGGTSEQFERLFQHLAPSLRKEFETDLRSLLSRCETLSFAPESAIGDLREPTKLKDLTTLVETLLSKFIKAASVQESEE